MINLQEDNLEIPIEIREKISEYAETYCNVNRLTHDKYESHFKAYTLGAYAMFYVYNEKKSPIIKIYNDIKKNNNEKIKEQRKEIISLNKDNKKLTREIKKFKEQDKYIKKLFSDILKDIDLDINKFIN